MVTGFPGFDGGGYGPLPGDDPVLGAPEAAMHLISAMTDGATSAQRSAMYEGKLEDTLAGIMEVLLTNVATQVMTEMDAKPEWKPVMEAIRDLTTSPASPLSAGAALSAPLAAPENLAAAPPQSAAPEAPAASSAPPKEGHPAPAEPGRHAEETPRRPQDAYKEGVEQGRKMTMGSIAKKVSGPMQEHIQNHGLHTEWATQIGRDAEGNRFKSFTKIDPSTGEPVLNALGEPIQLNPGDEGYDTISTRLGRSVAMRGTAQALLAGDLGAVGALGATAARLAGPIGLTVGAVQAGASWLENQEAAAQPYKAIYGESTSTFAAKERFGTWMEGLKGWGNIGAEEARAQYQRASEMGLTGGRRDDATDFMRNMQRRFGMDTNASSAVVQSAIDQGGGTASLNQFAEAITNVSRAAVAAGRASNEAIGQFVGAQRSLSSWSAGTGGTTQLAQNLTEMSLALPRDLSKQLGGAEGLAGMLTQTNVMSMAALSGQSPTAAIFNMSDPGSINAQGLSTIDQIGDLLVRQAAQMLGMSEADFRAEINRRTGGKTVSAEEQHQIIAELAGGPDQAGVLLLGLNSIANSMLPGESDVDQAQVLNLLFTAVRGGFTMDTGDSGSGGIGSSKGVGDYDKVKKRGGVKGVWDKISGGSAYEKQRGEVLTDIGIYDGKSDGGSPLDAIVPEGAQKSVDAYVAQVAKTGQGSGATQWMLNSNNRKDILDAAGVKSLDEVTVRLPGGKDTSLPEAIKSGTDLATAAIVNSEDPSSNPTSVTHIIRLSPEADEVLRYSGPTEEQRNGVPPSGTTTPQAWTRQGR